MIFKDYSKQYEDVFTNDEALKKCDLTLISNDKGMTNMEYINMIGTFLKDTSNILWTLIIQFHWLQRRFFYRGKQHKKSGLNNFEVDNSFATFTKHYLGINHRIITSAFYYGKVTTYLPELFPAFDDGNPLKDMESYQFPYKNITVDFLTVVYQMPERMQLLEKAEQENMSYAKFLDYVLNYVSCYNEEHPGHFSFIYVPACPPYVRYNLTKRNKNKVKKLNLR